MDNNPADIMLVERRQEAQERNAHGNIREHRGVYRTRLVLRFLSLATCVTIVALLTLAIRQYSQTKHARNPFHDGSGTFPVWPEGLKLYPSYVLLGAAVIAGLLSLFLVVASFHKNVRLVFEKRCDYANCLSGAKDDKNRKHYYDNYISGMPGSVDCCNRVLWLVGHAEDKLGSLVCLSCIVGVRKLTSCRSWSCTHQDPRYDYQNIDFSEMCTEMVRRHTRVIVNTNRTLQRFAFWAGVGLAGMEALNLLVFVVWWFRTRRSHGYKNLQGGKDSNNFAGAVGGMLS